MVRGKSVCLFFATKLQKISIYGQKTGNFYEIIRIQFPFGVHIPSLSVPDTVAPCFVYRCRSLPPGCPKTYQLLSFCHGERSRAISLNLQERVLRSLDCARDDRMIVSEEFSDNLPRCPPPLKTVFPALLGRLIGGE